MNDETLFEPARMPALDEMGYVVHPDLDRFLNGETTEDEDTYLDADKLRDAGFEESYVSFEIDPAAEPIADRYFEDGDGVVGWKPTPPDGDGWVLVAIYDTENGPYAMFVRPVATA